MWKTRWSWNFAAMSMECRSCRSRRAPRGAFFRPDRDLVELRLEPRADALGRARLPRVAQVLVAGNVGILIEDADRDRVLGGRDLAGLVDVARIVLALVLVDPARLGGELQTVLVREQERLRRIV